MNVTRHNFDWHLSELQKDVQLPTCRFVAIDTEFTGLSPNDLEREQYLDTLEERYRKVKRAGESFLVTQFGLSTVHVDQQEQFQINTWNFYVFPRPYGSLDERFLCQASSLQFLSEHGFDFNKFIGDGIPFVNLSKTSVMKKQLQRRIDGLTKVNKNLHLSDDGIAFQKNVKQKLDQWIARGAKKGEKLLVSTKNSFYSMIVHETARAKSNSLYSEATDGGVEVLYLCKKRKDELIAAKVQQMRNEMDKAIGFSNVVKVLSESKLPIVGHNALLDFIYVFHQFYRPLPETLAEFKLQLLELFPTIYDTKHVALRSPLGDKLKSTSLSSLFDYMRSNVKPEPGSLIPSDKRFDTYREALKVEADDNNHMLCHEAGFDAFMTAVCFIGLLAHNKGKLLEQPEVYNSNAAHLKQRLEELESFKNQLNLMISDQSFLDLGNADQRIDRARVYHVSSTTKRRIQHACMEGIFKSSKIQRIVRQSDQDAYVVLTEPATVNDEVTTKLGLTITTYDEHVAAKAEMNRQEQEDADRKLYSAAHTLLPEAATKEESVKNCVMSIVSDNEQRGVPVAETMLTSTARSQCEAKRAEIQRLRDQLNKVRAGKDDEDALLLALAHPVGTTDPLSCFCCCKFKRLGQSYILHEQRVVSADGVTITTKLVIVGPHWIGVLVTLGIILVSTAMFLSQNIDALAWYNTVVTFGLCGTTLYYLFQTTLTDPGIIQTLRQKDETQIIKESVMEAGLKKEMLSREEPSSRGRPSRQRYCDICGIDQDISTDHCEDCGVCVAGYDHHCPWMGKCIGQNNIHAFKMFNLAWIMYVCFVLVIIITNIDWGRTAVETLKRTASGDWVPT